MGGAVSTVPDTTQPAAAQLAAARRSPIAVAASAARRPLFLGAALRARVDADGPALRMRAERRAETRFPLDRVSRVVASARVSWSADALRACLESAIPIVIVGPDGSPLGSIQPARMRPSPLGCALEELLERPDWRDIYSCWLRAARMRVLADWRRARQAEGAAPDPIAYQELVKKYVYRGGAAAARDEATPMWRAAVYALAVELTDRWRLPPSLWGPCGEPLDLRRDLAQLMELRLRLEVRREAEVALKGEPTLLFVFHAVAEKLEFEGARALRSLARRVNEVLARWC